MFFNFNKRKGFTLTELLVVISIIGILSSITLVNLKGVREKVRDANRISDMKQIIVAIELYRDKNGDLPGRIENCEVEGGVRLGERGSCVDHELFEFINVPADPLLDAQNYYYAYDPISCNDNVCDGRGGAVIGFNQSESGIQDREASCGAEENLDNAAWNRIICYGNNRGSGCETCSSLEVECGTDLDDGCGGTINCFCPNGETCDNGTCVSDCTPETCSSLEVECGTDLDDGCGGTINCSCPNGETCDSGVCVYETCGDVTFTYNGSQVTYGTVVYDGECWMDRNLGASREAQSYDDSEAYGDLFQWGRPDDGHQERSSGETSTLADSDHPGHSDFINSPSDWRDPQNDNMWNTDGSGSNDGESCPEGWRVPSETEWSSVSSNWSDRSDAFNSVLKLPCGGFRSNSSGSIYDAGSDGRYWSSSVDGTDARKLHFSSSLVRFLNYYRARGLSVRCLRDSGDSSSPTSLNTDYIKIKTNPQAFDLTNLDLTNVTFEHIPPFSCGDDITFTYNGTEVTYGTVATSGECWMDRNLGASQVATSYDDSNSYGDLVQWGRPDDGHQERTSATTSVLADSDHPGHSNFITNTSSPYDWRDPQNDNMWNTDGSGSNNRETCPEGWRVPSESEWSSVSSNWSNRSDAFNSALKLPSAGSRDYFDGSIDNAGSYGYYWFSSVDDTDVRFLYFNSSDVLFFPGLRALGLSVRCLRDSGYSSSPTSLNTDYIKIKTNPQAFDLTNLDLTNVTFEHITPFSCGDDITFTYNGSEVTYGTVATSGECWMDRNLGASQVATSYDDSNSYGDLFQWGRPDDGHQDRSSSETSTLADSDHPGHSDFITVSSSPWDWRDPQNDNMWNEDGSGSNDGEMCPEGWHIPSTSTWSSVSSNWSDGNDAFASVLKLTGGGGRSDASGSIQGEGVEGEYWSSTVDGSTAGGFFFSSKGCLINYPYRAVGRSVRCLRDSNYSTSPTPLNTDYIKIKTNINVNSGTRASTTWSGLNNDTTYSWYVVADDGSATTSSDTWSFETNKTPDSPSNLKQYKSDCVTEINGGDWINETEICLKGQITDSDSADQVKLQVDYATSSDSFDNIVDVASTEWCSATCTATTSLSGLNSGTQYKWQARSIDDQGASSSFVQFNGDSAFRVDTVSPSGGSVCYIDGYSTSSSIEIDLSDGTDSTSGISTSSRLLQRKEANLNGGSCGSFNSFSNLASGSDITYSTHTDSALSNDTCYQYRYLVEDEAGNNATYTSSNILKVDTEPPANLRNLSIVKIEKNSISLDWEKAADNQFDYYEIWYGENQTDVENRQNTASEWSVTEDPDLSSVTTINTKISGLTAETGYYFKLWVVDKAGLENSSGPIFQTTAASGPKEIFRGEGIKLDGFNFGL